jgi:hypothetical protein
MMRRWSWIGSCSHAAPRLTSLALFALVLTSCAQEDPDPVITPLALAAQQCGSVIGCGCPFAAGLDIEACTDSASSSIDSIANAAEAAGLLYDADCAARQAEWFDELGCSIQNDELLLTATCALTCPLYHGYVGPGEACTVVAQRATNCAAGLDCVGGICQDVCNNWRLAEGATCYDPINPPTGTCVTGTHCDIGQTDRCIPTPGRGEPCPGNVCGEGDFCNNFAAAGATCEAIKAVGEPCLETAACATGYCTNNLCAPYPTIGQSCTGECADDLYCQAGICTVKQSAGQSCDFDLPCASGLSCDGTVCVQGQPLICGGVGF